MWQNNPQFHIYQGVLSRVDWQARLMGGHDWNSDTSCTDSAVAKDDLSAAECGNWDVCVFFFFLT
jgi:hypothetical protein